MGGEDRADLTGEAVGGRLGRRAECGQAQDKARWQLAGDQLIKALGAVLTDVADDDDFVGHIEADDFFMIVKPDNPERKAEKICQQFDSISRRFYPKGDIERGYLISTGRGGIRRRIPLISIAIGIVSSTKRRYQSYVDVLTSARDYRYLSKQYSGSTWVTYSMPEPVQH